MPPPDAQQTRGPQAVVLAGGLATRMRPHTERVPKLLLPVAGRPFADWLLERLAAAGYAEVLLCIAHLGDAIRDAVGDGRRFGIAVAYADEGPSLRGTAGALRAALEQLAPTFLVTYGDSLLPFDYRAPLADLEAHPEALGTMAVFENRGQWDTSNTAVEGERVIAYRKGAAELPYIDYGALALRREVVAALPPDAVVQLDAVQARLAAGGWLRAQVAAERFYEIGSPEGLADLERYLQGSEARR
ncbi:MAG: sugar phosphate nucleotidyltransferase [Polyangiaceae bacterium]